MASSLHFNSNVKEILPELTIQKLRVVPFKIKEDITNGYKLCLIAKRPLSDEALYELKTITGISDYEIQLVGEDVLDLYISRFLTGKLYIS